MRAKSPYYWVADPLLEHETVVERAMFGCDALYLHGKLMLVLAPGKEEPWKGILVPTFREYHDSLIAEFPELEPHEVLGKWLYLSEAAEQFDDTAERLARVILRNDPRIGVEPELKKKRPTKRPKRVR